MSENKTLWVLSRLLLCCVKLDKMYNQSLKVEWSRGIIGDPDESSWFIVKGSDRSWSAMIMHDPSRTTCDNEWSWYVPSSQSCMITSWTPNIQEYIVFMSDLNNKTKEFSNVNHSYTEMIPRDPLWSFMIIPVLYLCLVYIDCNLFVNDPSCSTQ